MCCLCCDIYKWLDILVFSDKDNKWEAPSHSSFTVLILVGCKRTRKKVGGIDPSCVVQPFMGWLGNEGVDINWNVSPVSSPVTLLSHRGEFNKVIIIIWPSLNFLTQNFTQWTFLISQWRKSKATQEICWFYWAEKSAVEVSDWWCVLDYMYPVKIHSQEKPIFFRS